MLETLGSAMPEAWIACDHAGLVSVNGSSLLSKLGLSLFFATTCGYLYMLAHWRIETVPLDTCSPDKLS